MPLNGQDNLTKIAQRKIKSVIFFVLFIKLTVDKDFQLSGTSGNMITRNTFNIYYPFFRDFLTTRNNDLIVTHVCDSTYAAYISALDNIYPKHLKCCLLCGKSVPLDTNVLCCIYQSALHVLKEASRRKTTRIRYNV